MLKSLFTLLFLTGSAAITWAQTTGPDLISPDLWKAANVPFYFKYDGKDSTQFLSTWQSSDENVPATGAHVHDYIYIDPASHLKVTAEVKTYDEFPTVIDWVLKFKNDGTGDTPIIENILPLHWGLPAAPGDCFIRHAHGSNAGADDFEPMEEHFGPTGTDHFESNSGNPSTGQTMPYFNLQTGDHGLIGAIGWSGNWKGDFQFDDKTKLINLAFGMKATHLVLHPGEEIRTPRIVLMGWKGGDWQVSQNGWRRLLFAHYTPQDNGTHMIGPVLFGGWGSEDIKDKIALIDWVHENKIPVNLYAVDAGWYGSSIGPENGGSNPWWANRGDWFPSPVYYPNGIKPLGEACKNAGLGFSLWIEPETTMPKMKMVKDHPDWYLHSNHPVNEGVELANYSDPKVVEGITDLVSGLISDFGMTWYRQDFNIPPEEYWALNDKPDRIGITEIGHVEGLYKFWDDLLAKHPGLHIDNCASGGRRLDIELMSRSFSIWRTDYGFNDTLAEQAQTQALAFWVPQNMGFDTYASRSPWKHAGPYSTPESLYLMRLGYDAGYGTGVGGPDVKNPEWVAWLTTALNEYKEVQPYIYGDFYPLLPYSRGAETWTLWQWDRPEKKDGLIIALRRPESPFPAVNLSLHAIQPDAMYEVEIRPGYEKVAPKEMKGSDLAHLQLSLPDAPSSTLVFYHQK